MRTVTKSASASVAAFEKLCALINDINFAMLTTVTSDGRLRSRPMGTQRVDVHEKAIWFFTASESPKTKEIYHEQQVCVSYANPSDQQYVSVSGQALVLRDKAKAKELWTPAAEIWFPKGVDDPRLILLRVGIESAEYWDSSTNAMVYLFSQAKAMLTGESPKNLGENVKVDLL